MTATASKQGRSYSWIVLVSIFTLLGLSSLAILFGGPVASDFEGATGVMWVELEARDPNVANYVAHLLGLVGVAAFGFALLGGAVAATTFRDRQRLSWIPLLIISLAYLGFSAVFVRYGFVGLAGYYLVVAALILLVLGFSARRDWRRH